MQDVPDATSSYDTNDRIAGVTYDNNGTITAADGIVLGLGVRASGFDCLHWRRAGCPQAQSLHPKPQSLLRHHRPLRLRRLRHGHRHERRWYPECLPLHRRAAGRRAGHVVPAGQVLPGGEWPVLDAGQLGARPAEPTRVEPLRVCRGGSYPVY